MVRCEVCKKYFMSKKGLNLHMTKTHQGWKPYISKRKKKKKK